MYRVPRLLCRAVLGAAIVLGITGGQPDLVSAHSFTIDQSNTIFAWDRHPHDDRRCRVEAAAQHLATI